MTMTDDQYIFAIKNNDHKAISLLYSDCGKYFHNTVKHWIVGLPFNEQNDYINDLYHDSIVILVDKIQNTDFKCDKSLRNYLVGIGKFKHLSANRKRITRNKYEAEIKAINLIFEDDVDYERDETIDLIIRNMGEPCSSLLKSAYWEELSGQEIAIKMGYKNSDSVKSQKAKCMSKIKVRIHEFIKKELL